jgi:hypothetical protein
LQEVIEQAVLWINERMGLLATTETAWGDPIGKDRSTWETNLNALVMRLHLMNCLHPSRGSVMLLEVLQAGQESSALTINIVDGNPR